MGITYWYLFIFTGVGTAFDIRDKQIPFLFLLLGAIGVIPIACFERNLPLLSRILGISVGIVFFCVSFLTNEAVGKGDSALIMIIGAGIGVSTLCALLLFSFGMISLFSLGLIVIKKVNRKARIPFYPFIAAGELVLACCVLLP